MCVHGLQKQQPALFYEFRWLFRYHRHLETSEKVKVIFLLLHKEVHKSE